MVATDSQRGESVAAQAALWAIPVAALVTILILVSMGFGWIAPPLYPVQTWVFFGSVVLTALLVAAVVLLLRTSPAKPKRAPTRAPAEAAGDADSAEAEVAAPAAADASAGDEVIAPTPREDPVVAAREPEDAVVLTAERLAGRRVAEYQRPAKDAAGDAIYTGTVVAVAEDLVLRVEDRVAERRVGL